MTDGSSDDPKNEETTVAGAERDRAAESASANTNAEAEAESEAESEAEEATRPAAESDGEPEAPADADADTEPEAGAASDAGSGAEQAPGADAPDGETEPGTKTREEADAKTAETPADTPDTEAEAKPEAEDSRTQMLRVPPATAPADEPGPEAKTADEADTKAEDTTADAPDTKPEAPTEPKPEAGDPRRAVLRAPRPTAPDDKSGTKTADADPTDSEAEPKATAEPKPEPEAEADDSRTQMLRVPRTTAPKAEDKPEVEADHSRTQILRVPRTTAPDDKPKASEARADAPDTPVTEPEPKPEPKPEAGDSRTQVLRVPGATAPDRKPKPEAEPEADASRTQVLRAPGTAAPDRKADGKPDAPGKKAADSAPKVPSWAAAREEDADPDPERSSRFVALKDLDAAPPVTERPQTRPQPQPRPQPPARVAAPQPLPPLDLLADLTNTPPPPETPRRTVLRRVKVWTPILLLLVGACIGGQMLRPLPDPRLVAAETDHTVDGQLSIPWPARGQGAVRVVGSGDIGTFGDQRPVPTASVAKIMTAYVVLKGHPLRKTEPGPDITVDAKTVADGNSADESRITGLSVGSKFSQQDMLKMLMIPSGNNVARLLARWDTGTDSEAAFVEKMNAAARELGMQDTVYTDPSGLDAGTVSTAADQLKLAEAVMKDETFRAIVALPEAPIKGLGEKLINNNDLLTVQGLSIRGIKTGSSTPAGGTFVWAAYKSVGDETPLIIGSLMEQRAPAPDKDALNSLALVKTNSKKIIEAVRAALASTPIVRKGDVVGYVDDGLGGRTPLVAVKDLNAISVPGQSFKLSLKAGASPLPHTAKDGTEVGVLTAGEGEGAKSVPVAVKGALAEPSFGTRLTRLG
ncbi:serine hydrolase [Streptomyces erythrochromogenes]|uniref:D-alanyl-D-alanine carboxypeptidase n=1 Tax=Streptomyces erythrochromogenes TaxID=285574 RepID=UPI00386B5A34|nr:serine hydrolase [Streptomyces erythrochromogenes]